MKLFLLDTNILVGYIRAANYAAYVEKKFNLFNPDNISVISVVTIAEVKSLAYKFGWGNKKIQIMNDLLKKIPSVKIDSEPILKATLISDKINSYNTNISYFPTSTGQTEVLEYNFNLSSESKISTER